MIDKVKAKTDKQYDEMWRYVMNYTNENLEIKNGQIHFYSNTETIIPKTETREFIISGENKEKINEIKKILSILFKLKRGVIKNKIYNLKK